MSLQARVAGYGAIATLALLTREETIMGFMANIAKLGIAKKAYDEIRKPENQAKIKSAVSSAKTKAQSRGKGTPPPR